MSTYHFNSAGLFHSRLVETITNTIHHTECQAQESAALAQHCVDVREAVLDALRNLKMQLPDVWAAARTDQQRLRRDDGSGDFTQGVERRFTMRMYMVLDELYRMYVRAGELPRRRYHLFRRHELTLDQERTTQLQVWLRPLIYSLRATFAEYYPDPRHNPLYSVLTPQQQVANGTR